jgi:hypothetical protein
MRFTLRRLPRELSNDDLISDLIRTARKLGLESLTKGEYKQLS